MGIPYLSIVLCGRNDNYGENYLRRLQTLVFSADCLSARFGLDCQIVFVEWNPPPGAAPMQAAIDWGRYCRVKIITVPPEIHRGIKGNHEGSEMHEFIGKNVGIRRADGEFVLSCNSDLVFAPDLFRYLAQRTLPPDCFIRAARINVEAAAGDPADVDGLFREILGKIYEANLLSGNYQINGQQYLELVQAGVTSSFLRDAYERRLFSFAGDRAPFNVPCPLLRQFPHLIFTNGAGDFMLMSKAGWLQLGGNFESDCRNHMDALMCYRAVQLGLSEQILPLQMCVFHQRHKAQPLQEYFATIEKYHAFKNPPDWGLADRNLPEVTVR